MNTPDGLIPSDIDAQAKAVIDRWVLDTAPSFQGDWTQSRLVTLTPYIALALQHSRRIALRAQLDTSMQTQETLAKNVNDGLLKIRTLRRQLAAALFPCFVWRLVYRQGNGWSGEYI